MSAARRMTVAELVSVALGIAAAIGIALFQPRLADEAKTVKQRDDVFVLPPPAQLRAMTLGYKHATADLLWAKLLVEWGTHNQEKRPFPDVTRYLDGILAVEPDFPTLYEFVDTILVYGPTPGTPDDARTARAYLERGTRERPYDHAVWLHYGQFLAFLAPSFLTDKAEIDSWRKDGAFALMRAVELGGDPDRSLSASTILTAAGEKKAVIRGLQRSYAMTDDPETRRQIAFKLQRLEASSDAETAVSIVENEWRKKYRFLSRSAALLLGPSRSPAACAGPSSYERKECPRDWSMAIGEGR
jgi:hypothetical protein